MSKILIGGLAAIVIAACSTKAKEARAEPETYAEGPALWALQDEDTVIHIFGLAPVLKTGTEWQSAPIKTALNEADLIVLEADQSPEGQAAMQALIPAVGINTDGAKLSAIFDEAEREEVNAISTSLGAPLQALDQLKPWLASVQLGVLAVSQGGFDLAGTPAAAISGHAADTGTPVRAFESATHLMELMSSFSAEEQKGMLLHTARTLRDDRDQQTRLADFWLAGDVDAIGETLHTSGGAWSSEVIYQAMLVERNQTWVNEIGKLLETEEGNVFIAVGFGHLAGPDSLITGLKTKGHSVTRR